MKRIAALLLSLCLLLAGCAVPMPETETGIPTTEIPTTEIPTTEPTSQTATTEPETPPTDISIKTDYSQYAPKTPLAPLYTPAEEPVYDLKPSKDYGAIYPYMGITSGSMGDRWIFYGFADEEGQILTEPVYSSVTSVSSQDMPPSLWLLKKEETNAEGYVVNRYAIASLDGSMVTECRYEDVHVDENYVIAEDYDFVFVGEDLSDRRLLRFDIYNAEGVLLLCSESLPTLAQIPDTIREVSYADGMLRLGCTNSNGYGACWYTNPEGSLLLGPYSHGDNFSEGLAAVSEDPEVSEGYYYIDKNGTPQFNLRFSYVTEFLDGVALVDDMTGQHRLIDRNGNTILQAEVGQSLYRDLDIYGISTDGVVDYFNAEGELLVDFYSAQGELLYEDLPDNFHYQGRGIFHISHGLDGIKECLIHVETKKCFTVPRAKYTGHYVRSLWSEGFEAIMVDEYDSWTSSHSRPICYLLSPELELLMEVEGNYGIHNSLEGPILEIVGSSSRTFYDENLNFLFSCPQKGYYSVFCEDRVLVFSEQYSLAYSLEGELIFCYPLPSFGGD